MIPIFILDYALQLCSENNIPVLYEPTCLRNIKLLRLIGANKTEINPYIEESGCLYVFRCK